MSLQNFEERIGFQLSGDYYSEIFTNFDHDQDEIVQNTRPVTNRENSYFLQMKLQENCPIIKNLPSLQPPKFPLSSTERWITYSEDETIIFPRDAFKSKARPLRECPRWKSQLINLKELGIEKYDLLSKNLLETFNISAPGFCENENFLPLEFFDDHDYRCRTPENWLEFSFINDKKYGLPAEAFLPSIISNNDSNNNDIVDNKYRLFNCIDWINVAVVDYNFDRRLWKILTLDGYKRAFYLPEIYVMFKADNPEIFATRIKRAILFRHETEMELKYSFHLDNMRLDGIQQPSPEVLQQIFKLSTQDNEFKYDKSFYINLEEEFKLQYQVTHCDLEIRHNVKINKDLLKFLNLPEPKWTTMKISENYQNIESGAVNFTEKRQFFQWMNIFVLPQIYQAMFKVVCECFKIEDMSLFNTENNENLPTLEEFESLQRQSVENIIEFLRGPWLDSIVSNLRTCLNDVDKGWFNIRQNNYETYKISKLNRFIELIKYRMQQSLRNFVMNTIKNFINFIEPQCLKCFNLTTDYQWINNLIDSPFIAEYPPIFKLYLIIENNTAEYSTSPDLFQQSLLELYDNSLIRTHKIPQIQLYLMDSLRFSKELFLSSVGLLDDEVCMIRERIIVAYQKAIIPLKAYREAFNIYLQAYMIDINEYLQNFQEINGDRIQEEIRSHRQIIDTIKSTLPDHVIIGPFFVIIKDSKDSLILERNEIIDKLIVMFAQFLKNALETLLDEYKSIILKLNEKPEDVETVFNMLEWIERLPLEIQLKEELTRKYLNEYNILDGFYYNLSDEDFNNRWEILSWPYRIAQQIQETQHFLEDEEIERFYKIQINDEAILNERIEQFTVQIAEIFKLYECDKLNETTIDIKSLWEEMKETEKFAKLLNNRQELFNVPVVTFDDLINLIEEFAPIAMEFDLNHREFLDLSDYQAINNGNSK